MKKQSLLKRRIIECKYINYFQIKTLFTTDLQPIKTIAIPSGNLQQRNAVLFFSFWADHYFH